MIVVTRGWFSWRMRVFTEEREIFKYLRIIIRERFCAQQCPVRLSEGTSFGCCCYNFCCGFLGANKGKLDEELCLCNSMSVKWIWNWSFTFTCQTWSVIDKIKEKGISRCMDLKGSFDYARCRLQNCNFGTQKIKPKIDANYAIYFGAHCCFPRTQLYIRLCIDCQISNINLLNPSAFVKEEYSFKAPQLGIQTRKTTRITKPQSLNIPCKG